MILDKGRQDDALEDKRLKQQVIADSKLVEQYRAQKPVLPKVHVPGGTKQWQRRNRPTLQLAEARGKPSTVHVSPVKKGSQEKAEVRKKKKKNSGKHQAQEPGWDREPPFFDTALSTSPAKLDTETQDLIHDVLERLEKYLKRGQMRVVDMFRRYDTDGNGFVDLNPGDAGYSQAR